MFRMGSGFCEGQFLNESFVVRCSILNACLNAEGLGLLGYVRPNRGLGRYRPVHRQPKTKEVAMEQFGEWSNGEWSMCERCDKHVVSNLQQS